MLFNLCGLAGGPLFVGMVSDHLAPAIGAESLRVGLLWLTPFAIVAAVTSFMVSRALPHDLQR